MLKRPGEAERPPTKDVRVGKNPAVNNRKVPGNIYRGNAAPAAVVHRPPGLHKVLQRKDILKPTHPVLPTRLHQPPLAKNPFVANRPPSKTDRPLRAFPNTPARPKAVAIQRRSGNSVALRFPSNVVQAVKFYPNLHPGAVEPIDGSNVFRLSSFANQYRLHRVNSHGVNVPNQQYNFVRTREGEMLLHARYRHPSIAEGKQVLYAGEIFFNNGQLEWWSNGSGHYQPYVEDAEQAALPMDHFFSYQQVIKGEHKRKKG